MRKQLRSKNLLIFLVAIIVILIQVQPVRGQEDNSLLAAEISMPYTINHYLGNIATQLYSDTYYVGYYTFEGKAGQLVRITASSSELGDWRLDLVYPNGYSAGIDGYNYKQPAKEALLEKTLNETGTYTVRFLSIAQTYNGVTWPRAGHYTLKSNLELTPTTETAYQNNNPTIHTINHYLGNIATQLYGDAYYVGYYTFEGEAGQLFRSIASSSELGDWRLDLIYPNGSYTYTDGYNYKQPVKEALLEKTLNETGTYTIRFFSRPRTYNGVTWPEAGHYTLESNLELTPTSETAYQNSSPTLYYDNKTLDSACSPSKKYGNGFMYKYSLPIEKGRLIRIKLTSGDIGLWTLRLVYPNGNYRDDEGYIYKNPKKDSLIQISAPETGIYTLEVHSQTIKYNSQEWPNIGNYYLSSNLSWNNEQGETLAGKPDPTGAESSGPTILTAEVISAYQIKLSWPAQSGVTGYNIYRADSSGKYEWVGAIVGTTNYFNDNYRLSELTTYTYKVCPVVDGVEGQAMTVTATTKSSTNSPPRAPSNFEAIAFGKTEVQLSWDNVSGATSYNIYRSNTASGNYEKIGDSISTSYKDTGLTSGTTYWYKITASNNNGESGYSYIESVTLGNTVDDNLEPGQTVSVNKVWTVRFNKDIDPTSANDNNIYVLASTGQRVKVNIAPTENKQIITVGPNGSWEAMMSYTLCLTNDLKSADGVFLNKPVEFKFTTQKPEGQETPSSYTVSIPKTTFNGGTVQITSNFPVSCKHVYYYLLDSKRKEYGIEVSTTSQAWPVNFDSSRYPNGEYTLYAAARDANNQLLYSQPVQGITINCSVNLTFTMDNPVYKDRNPVITPGLSFSAGSSSNYDFEIFVNGNGKGKNQLTWNVSGTSPGAHIITLKATHKKNGNIITSQPQTITVHAVPTVDFSVPASIIQGDLAGITPIIRVGGTDDSPANYVSVLYVDGKEIARGKGNAEIKWNTAGYTLGQHQLKVTIIHSKGVRSFSSEEKTVEIKASGLISLKLTKNATTIKVGSSDPLGAIYAPPAPSPWPNLKWSSTDFRVAYPEPSGIVRAVSEGTANIVVQTTDGQFSDSCKVTVIPSDPSPVVRRILIVGNFDYPATDKDIEGPENDVDRMQQVVQNNNFANERFSVTRVLRNAGAQAILDAIRTSFSEADDNDVSYFFYSGHGGNLINTTTYGITCVDEVLISWDLLEETLSCIPGTKVVMLSSCYSGGFINRVNLLNLGNKYKILTACKDNEVSLQRHFITVDHPMTIFAKYLCEGCGFETKTGSNKFKADTDDSGTVTLEEAYNYIKQGYDWEWWWNPVFPLSTFHVQRYPEANNTVIFGQASN